MSLHLHPIGPQILLQLFRAGKMHGLPAGGLGAFDIGERIVDEEAGGRIEAEFFGVQMVDRHIRLQKLA